MPPYPTVTPILALASGGSALSLAPAGLASPLGGGAEAGGTPRSLRKEPAPAAGAVPAAGAFGGGTAALAKPAAPSGTPASSPFEGAPTPLTGRSRGKTEVDSAEDVAPSAIGSGLKPVGDKEREARPSGTATPAFSSKPSPALDASQPSAASSAEEPSGVRDAKLAPLGPLFGGAATGGVSLFGST
ncbi:hypothetical protein T492DRAFT_894065, partial [Pavlovales sp. CCMP2436]